MITFKYKVDKDEDTKRARSISQCIYGAIWGGGGGDGGT